MNPIAKSLLLLLGHISLLLGGIGAILPIMPTTPFLILAAFAYSKSSPRMHSWLTSLPYFGNAIIEWETHKVINTKSKILASFVLIIVMGSSVLMIQALAIWHKVIMGLIALFVLVFIWTRKSQIE